MVLFSMEGPCINRMSASLISLSFGLNSFGSNLSACLPLHVGTRGCRLSVSCFLVVTVGGFVRGVNSRIGS